MRVTTLAKYIDQPLMQHKLHNYMPALLIGGGGAFALYDTLNRGCGHKCKNNHKDRKKNIPLRNFIVFATTAIASYIGAKGLSVGGKKLFSGLLEIKDKGGIIKSQTHAVQNFLKETNPENNIITNILTHLKERALKPSEIKLLEDNLPEDKATKRLFNQIFSSPKNLNSKEIMHEIKRLSLLGAVPIIGGVLGGVIADKVTLNKSKKSSANRVKEGFYQYFANIFLCNVGAAAALFGAEKLEQHGIIEYLTPAKRLGAIFAGIILMGIVGGSFIANYLGKKVIDPIFDNKSCNDKKGIYCERKPETLDIALHSDDLATAGVLAGLKWIEPALPFMYFISGYRAGTGYRNNENNCYKNK